MENLLLTITLILLVANLSVMYYMLKYNSHFLKQIQSIKGIQFNTLEQGEQAPIFRIHDQNGNKIVTKKLFFGEKNTLLLFINTKCPKCKEILRQLKIIEKHYNLNILVINNDEMFDDHQVRELLPKNIFYIRSPQIPISYYIHSTPSAVLVEKGKVKLFNKVNNFNVLLNLLVMEEKKKVS
ncbi:redoxin domain-containing protein [Sediminibacillus dalangtanensis]|uniref:Redoxin domain-containing protein n=1 Tax=Sediminibacillus dalangtanensis TaxID=2729421 RepID=A0ABX7VQT9_9BACI|nr:conjugal transfer protein TraF [Sediminibacillus dalangtanensis]QTM97920.1 redoxin domain-containing protein [Sediminibacillus dalangtanensis]